MYKLRNEIDDHLMAYLATCIKREKIRTGGFESVFDESGDVATDPSKRARIGQKESKSLPILLMIERRLKAELKMKENMDLRLLAKLINTPVAQVRKHH